MAGVDASGEQSGCLINGMPSAAFTRQLIGKLESYEMDLEQYGEDYGRHWSPQTTPSATSGSGSESAADEQLPIQGREWELRCWLQRYGHDGKDSDPDCAITSRSSEESGVRIRQVKRHNTEANAEAKARAAMSYERNRLSTGKGAQLKQVPLGYTEDHGLLLKHTKAPRSALTPASAQIVNIHAMRTQSRLRMTRRTKTEDAADHVYGEPNRMVEMVDNIEMDWKMPKMPLSLRFQEVADI